MCSKKEIQTMLYVLVFTALEIYKVTIVTTTVVLTVRILNYKNSYRKISRKKGRYPHTTTAIKHDDIVHFHN